MLALLLAAGALVAQADAELKDGDPTKVRLAIMAISADGVPADYAVGITETIATEIARTGVFDTISPKQIASILAYEKRKDALGGCVEEDCYVQVARLVKAEKLLGGSVAKIGEQLVLNLMLIDAADGKAVNRARRETANPSELLEQSHRTAIVLLQPLLNDKRGYLRISANVGEAAVFVDEERRAEGVSQVIALPAGPHTLRVAKEGFYSSNLDVLIKPSQIETARVSLIPAKETIESYESRASFMRTSAYVTGALAIAAIAGSAIFYTRASSDKEVVDAFAGATDFDRSQAGLREEAVAARDSFELNQGLYLGSILGAVVLGGASAFFFLAGDDPDRYEEFHALAE